MTGPKQHPSNEHLTPEAMDVLATLFTYHSPRGTQPERYQRLREAAREFARTIIVCCPACADRSAAIRKVREAVMTANASIALEVEE